MGVRFSKFCGISASCWSRVIITEWELIGVNNNYEIQTSIKQSGKNVNE